MFGFGKVRGLREKYEKKILISLLIIALISTILIEIFPDYLTYKGDISAILIFIALLLIDDVLSIKKSVYESKNLIKTFMAGSSNAQIFQNQTDANSFLLNCIEKNNYKNLYMIEYSSMTAQTIIAHIIEKNLNINIYLLLQHPEIAKDCAIQKDRILRYVENYYYDQQSVNMYNNIKILFYRQRASIRGRNFDNKMINLGWYKYIINHLNENRVEGHTGINMCFDESSPDFAKINKYFNETFKNLWENANTVEEVFNECDKDVFNDIEFAKWCKKISSTKADRRLILSKKSDVSEGGNINEIN